jgi:hypothetical protein
MAIYFWKDFYQMRIFFIFAFHILYYVFQRIQSKQHLSYILISPFLKHFTNNRGLVNTPETKTIYQLFEIDQARYFQL